MKSGSRHVVGRAFDVGNEAATDQRIEELGIDELIFDSVTLTQHNHIHFAVMA